MILTCKHVCVVALLQFSFYVLYVHPTSDITRGPKVVHNADSVTHKTTQSAHHTIKTTIHISPSQKHPTTHKTVHTTLHPLGKKSPAHNVTTAKLRDPFATVSANTSSDELYVDPSIDDQLSDEQESVSYEVIYANESDSSANMSYWLSLDDAFEILTEKKYDHMSAVHALMNSYNFFSRKKRFRPLQHGRQQPFVTIEGLKTEMRITLAEHLAELLEGKVVLNPTFDFHVILKAFGNNTELQRAYTTVTTYIAGKNARKTIETDPAIVPGYYLTEAAYVASQIYFPHVPPKNSSFWTWPSDLFKPDMIFYLQSDVDLNPNVELDPETLILKNSIMQIFSLWKDPPCIAIQNRQNYSCMLEEMVPHLNTILSK